MKKVISRILIILIIFIVLYEFIFGCFFNTKSYALVDSATRFLVKNTGSLAGGLVSIFYTLLKALIVGATFGIQSITTVVAEMSGINATTGSFWGKVGETLTPITPFDIFFNKYKLLDINFFDFSGISTNSFLYSLRTTVAQWYAIVRLISCSILLIILLYVGIRMALSTMADDKAKYKKMFADWVVSLVIIFILQFIIIFTVYCNDAIINALKVMYGSGGDKVSDAILSIAVNGIVGAGLESMASVIVYIMIVAQTIGFLIAYIQRVIKIGFLIMISPLISITYSIDKMGDGKAQALGNWLKEYVYTILIQPFHCIIYIALVKTAFDLLVTPDMSVFDWLAKAVSPGYVQLVNGVLAILCLKFTSDMENIVRKIFGFKDDNSSTSVAAGMALGVAALSNAKKIGTNTRKGINATKNAYSKAFNKDVGVLKNTRLAKALNKGTNALKSQKDKVTQKLPHPVKNLGQKIKSKTNKDEKTKKNIKGAHTSNKDKTFKGRAANLVKAGWDRAKRQASTANVLGIMAGAMMYSAGNTSALQAIGMGSQVRSGSQEFFSSSTGNISKENCGKYAKDVQAEADNILKIKDEDEEMFNQASALYAESVYAKSQVAEIDKDIKNLKTKLDDGKEKGELTEKEQKELENEISEKEKDPKREQLKKLADTKRAEAEKIWSKIRTEDGEKLKASSLEKTLDGERKPKTLKQTKIDEKNRVMDYAISGPKKENVKKQLSNIREFLINLQLKANGVTSFSELSIDKQTSVNNTIDVLKNKINLGVLNDTSLDKSEIQTTIARNLGIEGDQSTIDGLFRDTGNSIFGDIASYEHSMRLQAFSDNYAMHSKLNGDTDTLKKKDMEKIFGTED